MIRKLVVICVCVSVFFPVLVSCSNPLTIVIQDNRENQELPCCQGPEDAPEDAGAAAPDDAGDEDDPGAGDEPGAGEDSGAGDDPDEGEDSGAGDGPDGGEGSGAGDGPDEGEGSEAGDGPDAPDEAPGSGEQSEPGGDGAGDEQPDNTGGAEGGDGPGSGDEPDAGGDPGDEEEPGEGAAEEIVLTGSAATLAYLEGLAENSSENPYSIKVDGINLAGTGAGNALKGLYFALTRYVALDLRGSSGEKFANIAPKTALNKDKITGILLPPGLQTIEVNAFVGYTELVSADLGEATLISRGAFSGCAKLATLVMEEALTLENPAASGDGVFQNCESLVSVSLPRAALIGDRAFAGCVNLESLALGETPPALGNDVFADGTPLAIYVPSSALSAYKTTAIAGWTDALKAKVQALP